MNDNKCGMGYCTRGFKSNGVATCQWSSGIDWGGLCAYQNGNQVKDEEETIELNCCSKGCTMNRYEYARWNGLCTYMGK